MKTKIKYLLSLSETQVSQLDQTTSQAKLHNPITVIGHVKTARKSKKFVFIRLDDGSDVRGLQIISPATSEHDTTLRDKCVTGVFMKVTGKLVTSPASGQSVELQLLDCKIYGTMNAHEYPFSKKKHTNEHVRNHLEHRARTARMGCIMRVRNTASYATHNFYQSQGFNYVHTPLITSNDCEGAGETFKITTVEPVETTLDDGSTCLALPSKNNEGKEVDYSKDFFTKKVGLTVSGQLHGESYCLGLSDIYTFGPTFRSEKSETTRHLSEFWMVEPEIITEDLCDLLDLAENYVKFSVEAVLAENIHDLKFLDPSLPDKLEKLLQSKYVRLDYTDAIKLLEEHISTGKVKFENKVFWGCDLASEHEKYLTEVYDNVVMLCNYPAKIKSFYMKENIVSQTDQTDQSDQTQKGSTVACFDMLVPDIGELIGGSLREEDYGKLLAKMKEKDMDIKQLEWYLDLRKYSTVPHGGFGLGFERLVMLCSGTENIRDTIPFPRYYKHCPC
jgi:asparaginyl-tRNA synthetase